MMYLNIVKKYKMKYYKMLEPKHMMYLNEMGRKTYINAGVLNQNI